MRYAISCDGCPAPHCNRSHTPLLLEALAREVLRRGDQVHTPYGHRADADEGHRVRRLVLVEVFESVQQSKTHDVDGYHLNHD